MKSEWSEQELLRQAFNESTELTEFQMLIDLKIVTFVLIEKLKILNFNVYYFSMHNKQLQLQLTEFRLKMKWRFISFRYDLISIYLGTNSCTAWSLQNCLSCTSSLWQNCLRGYYASYSSGSDISSWNLWTSNNIPYSTLSSPLNNEHSSKFTGD